MRPRVATQADARLGSNRTRWKASQTGSTRRARLEL